ncbi:MAG: hypothetical protein QF664_02710 [Dehalococcoidia bacterium]|jgi:hypothetical protein|nr:hypothetical protein [Dehalococcoidia bacterium]
MLAAWLEFESGAPELAERDRWLLSRNDGVAFLATIRRDGSPQVHPIMPTSSTARCRR